MAVVLAQMWEGDNHMDGGWWWVMGIGWLLFLAFIGFLIYLLVRHHTDAGTPTGRRSTAEDLLAERLARGEIDEDERGIRGHRRLRHHKQPDGGSSHGQYRRRRDALRS